MARRANTGFFKDKFVNWQPAPYGYKGEVPMFAGNRNYQPSKLLSAIDLIQPSPNQAPMKVYWQGDVPTVYGKSGNRLALQDVSQGAYDRFMSDARVPVTVPAVGEQPNLPLVGRYGNNNIYKDRSLPIVDDGSMPSYMMQNPSAEFREIDYLISSSPKESAYDPDTLRDIYTKRQGQGLDEIEADITSRMGQLNPTWMNPDYDDTLENLDLFSVVNKQLSQGQAMAEADILTYGGRQRNSRGQIIPEYLPSAEEKLAGSYGYDPRGFLVDRPDAIYGLSGASISYPNTPIREPRNIERIPTTPAPTYQPMQVNEYGIAMAPATGYIRPPVSLSEPDINPLIYTDTNFTTKYDAKGRPFTTRQKVEATDPLAGMPSLASGGRWMGGGLDKTGRTRTDGLTNPLTNDNQRIRMPQGIEFVPMGVAASPNQITSLTREELNPRSNIMQYGTDDLYDYQARSFIPVEQSGTRQVNAEITQGDPIPVSTPMGAIADAYLPYTAKDGSRQLINYDPSQIENRPLGDGISTLDRDLADVQVRVGDEYFPLTPQAASSEYGDDFEDYGYGYRRETDKGMNWWDSDGPSEAELQAIAKGSKANFDDDIVVAAAMSKTAPAIYNDPNIYPTGALEAIQDRRATLNRINASINNRAASPSALNPSNYSVMPDGYVSTNDLLSQRNQLIQDINNAETAYSQLMQLEPANQMVVKMQSNPRVENQLESLGMSISGDGSGNTIARGNLPFMVNPSRSQYPELPLVRANNLSQQQIAELEQMREAASYGYIRNAPSPIGSIVGTTPEDIALQTLYQQRADNWKPVGQVQRQANTNYYVPDPEAQAAMGSRRRGSVLNMSPAPDPWKGEIAMEDAAVPNFATGQNQQMPPQPQSPKRKATYSRFGGVNNVTVDGADAAAARDYFTRGGVNFQEQSLGEGTVTFSFDDSNPKVVESIQRKYNYVNPNQPNSDSVKGGVREQINQANSVPTAQADARRVNPNINRGITLLSLGTVPLIGSQYEQSQAEQRAQEEAMLLQMYGNPGMNSLGY